MGGAVESVGDFIQDEIIDPVKEVGRDVDDFVNEEIPGGWYTVGAAAGGAYLYGGAGAATAGAAEAGTAGATAGTAGATAGTAGTGAGLSAGGSTAAGLGGSAGTGLTAGSTGAGFTATGAGAPGIASMGGGTGLLTAGSAGGTVGATGLTAAGAVPMLGSSGSFINNPAVLGTDVIGAQQGGIGLKQVVDAARTANSLRNLLNRPTAPVPNMIGMNQMPQGSVDYSPTLNLLAQRPTRADIYSLLG
jgi:hypothetical protein